MSTHKWQAQINWCREQIARSQEILDMFEEGVRWKRGVPGSELVDVTEKHKEREEKIIENMKRLIAAYEDLDA